LIPGAASDVVGGNSDCDQAITRPLGFDTRGIDCDSMLFIGSASVSRLTILKPVMIVRVSK
jgi:hypothetical protein